MSPSTVVATNDLATTLDRVQYRTQQGPCLEAIDTARLVRVETLAGERRWPDFVEVASSEGVVSSCSVPVAMGERTRGSLNLYSRTHAFAQEDERLAVVLAGQAVLGLATVRAQQEASGLVLQLQSALESRDLIGQAKGVLIERERVAPDVAFDMLRRASQRTNTKLRDVALQIVTSALDRLEPT